MYSRDRRSATKDPAGSAGRCVDFCVLLPFVVFAGMHRGSPRLGWFDGLRVLLPFDDDSTVEGAGRHCARRNHHNDGLDGSAVSSPTTPVALLKVENGTVFVPPQTHPFRHVELRVCKTPMATEIRWKSDRARAALGL